MSENKAQSERRRFLKTAALAGGAASVAVAAGTVVAGSTQPATPVPERHEAPDSQGYHVTPHIEAYYRLARQ